MMVRINTRTLAGFTRRTMSCIFHSSAPLLSTRAYTIRKISATCSSRLQDQDRNGYESKLKKIENVLEFWFGRGQTSTEVAAEKTQLWWSKNDVIDREILDRFAVTTEAAANGGLSHWAKSCQGLLALIICTDQFPRNMYRDTPKAFSYDSVALRFAKQCVNSGAQWQLKPIERTFIYMPFEHSEELAEQQRAVALFKELEKSAGSDEAKVFSSAREFAEKHCQIIERFGRFPHRNRILGRHSTDEERYFLEQPGSSF